VLPDTFLWRYKHINQIHSQREGHDRKENKEEEENKIIVLKSKEPKFNNIRGVYCLDFHSRVKIASVKNFQLVNRNHDPDKTVLEFGKMEKGKSHNLTCILKKNSKVWFY
jgi:hypothetical protein